MPADLIEELGRLLGEALVADMKQYPNLAEVLTLGPPTGRSSGTPSEVREG
jgi:hypothetical protein